MNFSDREYEPVESPPFNPKDLIDIARRRIWWIILPAILIIFLAALVAFLLPSVYRSSATILIEEQEIPQNFVMATVTSFAEQRLQIINQRIMSTSRLLEIIEEFDLYNELRDKWTTEQIMTKMRQEIKMRTISAEILDRRTGRPTTATIAFTLSFQGKSPRKVQQVTNKLTSLFLEENLKVRKRQTEEATTFLEDEMNRVKTTLEAIDTQLAGFKEKHINKLPEMLQVNIQTLNNLDQEIERLGVQARALQEREGYLETQLSSTPRQSENSDRIRLADLKTRLIYLQTQYTAEYPDVFQVTAEIAALEERLGTDGQSAAEILSQPDNPAYITLESQLASAKADIKLTRKQIKDVQKKKQLYQQRIESSPLIEKEYKLLLIDRSNTQAKFNDLMRKFMEAKVASGLESEQKGERFTLIDPPLFPEKPFKPNRLAILVVGIVLGIGAGVGTAALKEFTDDSIRSPELLMLGTSYPVLASIQTIVTPQDIRKKRIRLAFISGSVLTVVAGSITVFHFLIMDLNVFWAKLIRRVDMFWPY